MRGQCCKGMGVDCVSFVRAVLDELYRLPPTALQIMDRQLSLHDPREAVRIMRLLVDRYPNRILRGEAPEPGDVVIGRSGTQASPGHVLIVGPHPAQLWHVGMSGVCFTGWGAYRPNIVRIWRMLHKESWL